MAFMGILLINIILFPVFLLLGLAIIWIVLIYVFSIIGAIIFLIVEHYVKKHLNPLLQRIMPDKENIIILVNQVVNVIFLIIKISISLFAYSIFAGFLIYYVFYENLQFNIYMPFLLSIALSLLLIGLLKILKRDIKHLLNIFFLIEPYILTLIFLVIVWK